LMIVLPLLINAGFYVRNQVLFGHPLAANEKLAAVMVNARVTPQTIMSNAVRDAVVQFGTPDPRLNHLLEVAVTKFHTRVLHIGVSDPETTYPAAFAVNALSFNEDFAGDPLQTLLAIA